MHGGRVNNLLPRVIGATVVAGKKRGRKLGVATANLAPHGGVFPDLPHGVYLSRVVLGARAYPSVSSYGAALTFKENEVTLETHIIGLNTDLYGQELEVELLAYLRPLKKFDTKNELIAAMEDDIEQALALLRA